MWVDLLLCHEPRSKPKTHNSENVTWDLMPFEWLRERIQRKASNINQRSLMKFATTRSAQTFLRTKCGTELGTLVACNTRDSVSETNHPRESIEQRSPTLQGAYLQRQSYHVP
jgi:hypothetical protein